MTPPHRVTFVVMAGGRGERLWPLVRETSPKVCLAPDGSRSLLEATIDRLRPIWPSATWLIVTTEGQAEAVSACLPRSLRTCVLIEPQVKNTAACITLAAVALAARNPHQVMVVVPADHWVGGLATFRRAIRRAIHVAAAQDTIATIGIRPTHPHPGLGYLCAGSPIRDGQRPRAFRLARFVEKPPRAVAERLIRQRRTYWNSGTFVGTADKFLECVTQWLPEHTRRLVPLARGAGVRASPQRLRRAYRALRGISFDHGVMDHLRDGVIVEGHFAWADLGSWDAWARVGRSLTRTIGLESRNVKVVGHDGHLVATIGVRDLLVVHTPSATLICDPKKAQAVREVVRRISVDPRLARYR